MNSKKIMAARIRASFGNNLQSYLTISSTNVYFSPLADTLKIFDPTFKTGKTYYESVTFHFPHIHFPCMLGLDNTFNRPLIRVFSSGSNKPSLPTSPIVL